jgi:NADPH-dependent glutamate synthase beta subunit-like oxidoreductase
MTEPSNFSPTVGFVNETGTAAARQTNTDSYYSEPHQSLMLGERSGMRAKPNDMTPVVDLTREKGTGPIRTRRPIYVDLLPPCNNACPAGENIQAWLALAQAGKYRDAWEVLVRDNPMPAVHGRVCYHPCESACNRKDLDAAVSIHAVERFLGDLASRERWAFKIEGPPSGKRVLVVGAGPSGLSAAYHLARMGHTVEIHEAGPLPGGMMQFGIPAFRLPREELLKEIRRIEAMGVEIVLERKVEDVLTEKSAGRFDAVFIAIGAHIGKHVDIPARDAVRVLDAISFLRDAKTSEPPRLGRRVVIYGGGNTAMDAARTARRLGADEALIVYRRDRAHILRKVPGIEFQPDRTVIVAPNMMTGYPGVFAGGDMVPSERTVTVAVGHGKRAACHIDAWLRGGAYDKPAKHPVVDFAMLNLPIYADAEPSTQRELVPEERIGGFDEVLAGLSEQETIHEAKRCLSCGNCFECDNCYAACPEDAIIKLGPGQYYRYDYMKCTGCAVCFEQCPCHAIELERDSLI